MGDSLNHTIPHRFCVYQHIPEHSCHTHLSQSKYSIEWNAHRYCPIFALYVMFTSCWIEFLHRIKWQCPFPIDISITIANWNIDLRYVIGLTNMFIPFSWPLSFFRQFNMVYGKFFHMLSIIQAIWLCARWCQLQAFLLWSNRIYLYITQSHQTRLKSISKIRTGQR